MAEIEAGKMGYEEALEKEVSEYLTSLAEIKGHTLKI